LNRSIRLSAAEIAMILIGNLPDQQLCAAILAATTPATLRASEIP
jgi:hypothetical protein